jgi:hypothetical protein
LSGRQISGGGSSPNSRRITSARDVISQHSMGGGEKEEALCERKTILAHFGFAASIAPR